VTTEALLPPTYRRLLNVHGFPALAGSALLSRTANRMWEVGMVLFVLQHFHSASLAGLTVFLSIAPGLALSPLSGALLDRHGRRRLIFLDNALAAVALVVLGLLAMAGALSIALLLLIVSIASLTFPLTASGTRSLFPLVIPRDFWDLGNAVDSGSEAFSSVLGPALAGAFVAVIGGPWTLLVSGAVFLLGGLAMLTVPEARSRDDVVHASLLRAALDGVRYVVRNRSLRALAIVMSVGNLGYGQLVVILPVLVLQRFHGGAGTVGALWAVQGAAAVASGVIMGRLGSVGRERSLLALGFVVLTVGFAVVALPWWAAVVVGMVACGLSIGPIDIALFSLRQRRTDPAWFGRAFAVSMALNFAGMPLGSGMAGPIVSVSLTLALAVAAALSVVAAVLCVVLIPRDGPASAAD
jgi:MFS family permease